jgi:hypothetical protein
MQTFMAASNETSSARTNLVNSGKPQPYVVQPGDTLLKILARANDTLARAQLPEITFDQVVRANPGLNADRIRVGQTILIPLPETR